MWCADRNFVLVLLRDTQKVHCSHRLPSRGLVDFDDVLSKSASRLMNRFVVSKRMRGIRESTVRDAADLVSGPFVAIPVSLL